MEEGAKDYRSVSSERALKEMNASYMLLRNAIQQT